MPTVLLEFSYTNGCTPLVDKRNADRKYFRVFAKPSQWLTSPPKIDPYRKFLLSHGQIAPSADLRFNSFRKAHKPWQAVVELKVVLCLVRGRWGMSVAE